MRHTQEHLFARFRSHSWVVVGAWTSCIVGSMLWNLRLQEDHRLETARNTAQITFENDVRYRRWAASRGGVYVPVSQDTPPNPYLQVPERDVTTTSGLSLTLVNPAYMARLVHELPGGPGSSRGHVTSLTPIRPENAADAWEAAALRSFEQGGKEVSSVEKIGDAEYLRLMRPFVTEKGCLKCHAAQGYQEGDIRGGISVSVPMAPLRAIDKSAAAHLAFAHLGLWLVGLAGIAVSRRSLGRELLAREQAEGTLRRFTAELEQRVAAQTAEIRQANDLLEQRIAERTAALEAANTSLRQSQQAALTLMEDAMAARGQVESAAAELRASEEKYRNLFANMAEEVHFWQLVRDGVGHIQTWRLVDVNPPALKSWGRQSVEEIRGKTTDEIFGPGATVHYLPIVQKIMTEGLPHTFEDYFPHLDKYFRFTSVPLGEFFVTTGVDITGIKKAELALRASEERLREANAELQQRVAQEQSASAFLREARRAAVNLMQDALASRERAEQASRELQLIVDSSPAMIFYKDRENQFLRVNRALAETLGATKEQLERRSLFDLFPQEQAQAYWQDDREVMAGGQPKLGIVEPMQTPAGARWVQTDKVPSRDAQGNLTGIIGFATDITERKRAEQELKASLAEKEVLLKEIHHRVKNNMQVISSLVSLQADQLPDQAMRAVLQDVTHRVRSMALVHEKLYQSADLARVEFAEYTRSLLSYLWRAHGTGASGVRLRLDLEQVPLSVNVAVPCGLILNELATNALKHAFPGTDAERGQGCEVRVSLSAVADGQVCLRVCDNGAGLPAGLDWQRADSLGLRLVQILAKQLGAVVDVSSGVGTEFAVTFPEERA